MTSKAAAAEERARRRKRGEDLIMVIFELAFQLLTMQERKHEQLYISISRKEEMEKLTKLRSVPT